MIKYRIWYAFLYYLSRPEFLCRHGRKFNIYYGITARPSRVSVYAAGLKKKTRYFYFQFFIYIKKKCEDL